MEELSSLVDRLANVRVIRFVIAGFLNTAFSYLLYATFIYVGLGYRLANLLALIIGILFSFMTQGRFVFYCANKKSFVRFVLSWVVIYSGTVSVIGWLISLGFNSYQAGALSLPFSVVLSYLSQRYYVFRSSPSDES